MELGECDLDHVLKLSTDLLKLEGTLHIEPLESVKGLSVDALQAYLIGNEVRSQFIDRDALELLYTQVMEAPLEHHEMVVAQGTPAINGDSVTYTLTDSLAEQIEKVNLRKEAIRDGTLDEPEKVDSNGIIIENENEEAVSHYDQMSFVVVRAGDKIAMKTEKSDGSDGCDLFGGTIPAHEGKTNEGVLDDSILVAHDGTCTAVVSGVLTAVPGHISVCADLEIKEDVDFQTGRIIFPGPVTVGGAVRDRFCVRAEGDIEIRGLVEAADLESEKNIRLTRGMAGKETGTIQTKMDLTAGYLEGVIAQIGRDVSVKGEITNCDIKIRNQLNAEYAAVRGGCVQASMGASVGAIGSVQGVETDIEIGSLPDVEKDIRTADSFIERLEAAIQTKTSAMDTYSSVVAKPTASQIEDMMGMQFEIDELALRLKQLNAAKGQLMQLMTKFTSPKIHIHKAIYAKVTIYLPGYRAEFPTDLMGESTIEIGQSGHPSITYQGQTAPLSQHARVISDDRILRVTQCEGALSTES